MTGIFRKGGLAAVVLAMVLVSGCSRVNMDNYQKLKVGMDFAEVEAIIGGADECSEKVGVRVCTWGNETKNITVTFVAGKATVFGHEGLS